jgi:hypothetical protein
MDAEARLAPPERALEQEPTRWMKKLHRSTLGGALVANEAQQEQAAERELVPVPVPQVEPRVQARAQQALPQAAQPQVQWSARCCRCFLNSLRRVQN